MNEEGKDGKVAICIKNEEFFIKNDGFCIKPDELNANV